MVAPSVHVVDSCGSGLKVANRNYACVFYTFCFVNTYLRKYPAEKGGSSEPPRTPPPPPPPVYGPAM